MSLGPLGREGFFFFLTYSVNSIYTNESTGGFGYIQLYLFFSVMPAVECSKLQVGRRYWKNSENKQETMHKRGGKNLKGIKD